MAEPKTSPTDANVKAFLDGVVDPKRKADCLAIIKLMKGVTKEEPVLWGASVVGFGRYTYSYPSGRTADWFVLGVSPRRKDISVYIMPSLSGLGDLLSKLGPHKCGRSCLYINSLADVDQKVLKELFARGVRQAKG